MANLDSEVAARPLMAALDGLAGEAADAAGLLRRLANANRLLLLCHMAEAGEMNVTDLCRAIGLGQAAVSQHLAMLREAGIVATRRESQAIYYRLADPKAVRLLGTLRDLYCPRKDD